MRIFATYLWALIMDNWNEIRTAACVARCGTISKAADELGVHRATINRHIDALEAQLGGKLFQRHPRGFTPTELGREMLRIADATDEQFAQLKRIANRTSDELSGEFIVTSIDALANSILPMLADFHAEHPQVTTHFHSSNALVKLEYGEAHIAFRAGPKPQEPDNVVMPFVEIPVGLYASKKYVARHGKPENKDDFLNHLFVGTKIDNPRAPALKWLVDNVPHKAIAFTSNHIQINNRAVLLGNGIGFLTTIEANEDEDLVEIMPPRAEWLTRSWALTHVDLHRSPKVQAFLKIMKRHLAEDA
jgi:DNA-binding transcriptional LysR family regulator